MDNDLFAVEEDVVTIDENVDYYSELVGEGKKFKSEKDLARGKWESDQYIKRLRTELEAAKAELQNKSSMEELVNKLRNEERTSENPPSTPERPVLTEDDFENKVLELLAKKERERNLETNMERVSRVLEENFGSSDAARLALNKAAKETGMSMEEIRDLAKRSPSAVFKLIGVNDAGRQPQAPTVPRNQYNPAASELGGTARNAAYYERMKQTDPKKYFSEKTTVEMIRDRKALGDKFYS